MQKTQISQAPGLVTASASSLVAGALRRARDMAVRRHGVYEQRRSLTHQNSAHPWGSTSFMPSIFQFNGSIFAWQSTDGISADLYKVNSLGGVWSSFTTGMKYQGGGTATAAAQLADYQRTAEAQGNLWLPARDFVYQMPDPSYGTITTVGCSRGREIQFTQTSPPSGVTGIYTASGSSAFYRICFTSTDVNGNTIRGAPSGIFQFTATAGSYATIKAWLPKLYGDSYEVYRSNVVLTGTSPSDELQLVWRSTITATDIANGYVQFTDLQPDGLKGQYLYTNQSKGGIAESNIPPPPCWDIAYFMGTMFYANPTIPDGVGGSVNRWRMQVQTLAIPQRYVLDKANGQVQAATPVAGQATYIFTNAAGYLYDFSGINTSMKLSVRGCTNAGNNGDFTVVSVDTANRKIVVTNGGAVNEGGLGGCGAGSEAMCAAIRVVSGPAGQTGYYLASYTSESVVNKSFIVTTSGSDPNNVRDTMASFARVLNQQTATWPIVCYDISDPNLAQGALLFELINSSTTFSIQAYGNGSVSGASGGTVYANKFAPALNNAISAVGDAVQNRILYSRPQEPGVTTAGRFIDIGDASPIMRIKALRNSLMVFKPDGLYRVSGDGSGSWGLTLLDSSIRLLHRNMLTVLHGDIYAMTNRGMMKISDTGREFISTPIDDAIFAALEERSAENVYPSHCIASEIDGLIYVYFTATTADATNINRTFSLTYCPATNVWTGDTEGKLTGGLDTSLLSLPGIQYKDPGFPQYHRIVRHGTDYVSFNRDYGDLYAEASLTEKEPPGALCWENKAPLPGDRYVVVCSAWNAGASAFTYASLGPHLGQDVVPEAGDLIGGAQAYGHFYYYWKITNVAGSVLTLTPYLVDQSDSAATFTAGGATRYYLIKGLRWLQEFQPFGGATGMTAKNFMHFSELLKEYATASGVQFDFWNEADSTVRSETSAALVEPTTRVDVHQLSSRCNRLTVRVQHTQAGQFHSTIGNVYEFEELDSQETT